jgi:hypothetical protein
MAIQGGYRARGSSSLAFVWVAGALVLGVASLGLVHHASAVRARERAAARPLEPIVVVDLARNRAARGGKPLGEIEAWRAAASDLGRELEVFEGNSLADIPSARFGAWVLPAQDELSDADFAALDSYLEGGRGLVLTGGTGRAGGRRAALTRLFPGEHFAEVPHGETHVRVTGRGALAAGLEPGADIALSQPEHAFAAQPGDILAWGDEHGAAGLHGRYRGGSIAWLAFGPDRVTEPAQARALAANALRFASREPLIELRPWPNGRPCAVLIEASRESGVAAECSVDASKERAGELQRLAQAGCRFASVPAGERLLPQLVDAGGPRLVEIPESSAGADAHGAELMRELLAGYERAERSGGIYSLRGDTPHAASDSPKRRKGASRELSYGRVRAELRARGAWFARPAEIADWWTARAGVRATLSRIGSERVRVTLVNAGANAARGVTARIYVPEGAGVVRLESSPLLAMKPVLRVAADRTWIEVVARSLDPGGEVSYTIRF